MLIDLETSHIGKVWYWEGFITCSATLTAACNFGVGV